MRVDLQGKFTDKDIASDLLSDLKEMLLGYHMATVESASPNVRSTFMNSHDDYMKEQRELWETMYSKGWYQIVGQAQQPGYHSPQGRM
jgi:spore coat protein CotF